MAIKIYHDAACTQEVTSGSPIVTEHSISGETKTVQVYVKNDNSAKYYTGVSADPTGTDESFVQLSLDNSSFTAAGAALSLADFGSAGVSDTTVRNLWVKVTTPVESDSQNRSNVTINVTAKEYAV